MVYRRIRRRWAVMNRNDTGAGGWSSLPGGKRKGWRGGGGYRLGRLAAIRGGGVLLLGAAGGWWVVG